MNLFSFSIGVVCLILVGCAFLRRDFHRRLLIIFSISLYSCLVAFQGVSGSDSHMYLRAFQSFSDTYEAFSVFGFSEPGFWLINKAAVSLSLDFSIINYVNAVVVFFSLYYISVKRSPFLTVLYIVIIGINVDFSTIRQSLGLHVFSIVYFVFKSQFSAVVVGMLLHKSVLLSYLVNLVNSRISLKIVVLAVIVLLFFNYFFLQRYLAQGPGFVFREGYVFILQTFIIVAVMALLGYSKKIIISVALLSVIPIGYRVIFFFLILNEVPYPVIRFNKLVLSCVLLCLMVAKVASFTRHSLENDLERSTILHYENYFK